VAVTRQTNKTSVEGLSVKLQKMSVLAAGHGFSAIILSHVTAKLRRDQLKKQRRKKRPGTEEDHKEAPEQEQTDLNLIPSRLLVATFASREDYSAAFGEQSLKSVPAPTITFLGLPDDLHTFATVRKERGKNEVTVVTCYLDPVTGKQVPAGAFNVDVTTAT
jgi:hypothetical protein